MVKVSLSITVQMREWADLLVERGIYKSRSEVVRELLRAGMNKN